jgi:septal ring factor EnvC (AmiA/AmiB activator)
MTEITENQIRRLRKVYRGSCAIRKELEARNKKLEQRIAELEQKLTKQLDYTGRLREENKRLDAALAALANPMECDEIINEVKHPEDWDRAMKDFARKARTGE